jgi:hypothetical protein
MADTTKFVIEGDMALAFFSGECDSSHVLLKDNADGGPGEVPIASGSSDEGERLETKIARELGFPNDSEFNEIFRKLDDLREKGMRPIEGVPDGTRDVKLRITVEVL